MGNETDLDVKDADIIDLDINDTAESSADESERVDASEDGVGEAPDTDAPESAEAGPSGAAPDGGESGDEGGEDNQAEPFDPSSVEGLAATIALLEQMGFVVRTEVIEYPELDPIERMEREKASVFKVHTTALNFDYKHPWREPSIQRWTGSGMVLEDGRLLTNAHVAGDSVYMEIRLAGDEKRYTATLKQVKHDCDLALLEVDDPEFWEKVQPLQLRDIDDLQQGDKVQVKGFPMGGDRMSVTEGIVSRTEVDYYAHSLKTLKVTQVDAPINPGNSGGPVFDEHGNIVGVAHQGYSGGQNLGYMIPLSVIKHFLRQVELGKDGFPELGIDYQGMQNSALRREYGVDGSGVLVTKVPPMSALSGTIQPEDVITSIDGVPVNNDGTVYMSPTHKIELEALVQDKAIGDEMTIRFIRNGIEREESVVLSKQMGDEELTFVEEHDKPPTYAVISGQLVVQPVTLNYMMAAHKPFPSPDKQLENQQLICISNVLASDATHGYASCENQLIAKVNGLPITSMNDLLAAVEGNEDDTHVIKLINGKTIVIDNVDEEKEQALLGKYYIPKDRSDDLPAKGQAKPEIEMNQMMSAMGPMLFSFANMATGAFKTDNAQNDAQEQESKRRRLGA